jgi:hypothetical protein
MHHFVPFLFGPFILFVALFKCLFLFLLIGFVVAAFSHMRRRRDYMQAGAAGQMPYGHGGPQGHGGYHGQSQAPQGHHGHGSPHGHHGHHGHDMDPRRVAAYRYASGKIDRAEFEGIIAGLDAATPQAEATATPPVAPPAL